MNVSGEFKHKMQRQGFMEDTDLYADEEEYENEEEVAPCPSCNDMMPFETLNEKKKAKALTCYSSVKIVTMFTHSI